jgi:hypothetical protein
MSFAATFDVKLTFDDPAAFAGFAAAFDKLYKDFFSGASPLSQRPKPQPAPALPEPPTEAPAATIETAPVVAPDSDTAPCAADDAGDKPKRRRRTKAEMEAARAEVGTVKATLDLPKPHGGANTGTTPVTELPAEPPAPTSDGFVLPAGECTKDDLQAAFAAAIRLPGSEIFITETLSKVGVEGNRVRYAQPHQYRPLCEAFAGFIAAGGRP